MGGTAAWGHSLAGQRPQYPFASGLGKRETKHSESDEGTALASSLFCILLLSGIHHVYFQGTVLRTRGHAGLPGGIVSCGKGWMALMSLYIISGHHSEHFFCIGDPGVL